MDYQIVARSGSYYYLADPDVESIGERTPVRPYNTETHVLGVPTYLGSVQAHNPYVDFLIDEGGNAEGGNAEGDDESLVESAGGSLVDEIDEVHGPPPGEWAVGNDS